jgi:outer membrane lipoprotein-sorting protein
MLQRSCALVLLAFSSVMLAGAADTTTPSPEQIQDIIKKFTQKETEFAAARENYTYRQTSKLTETDPPGGSYEIVEEVSFDDRNRRTSHVLHAPVTSLENILMTAEDEQDLRNVMPFVMTNDTLNEYNVSYVGREKVDEITCYVFNVSPKMLTKDRKRYFDGKIWVDDQDLQIVKTFGRSTGYLRKGEDQQFPRFETYREQIDGKYWFPTYTYADDILNFKDGPSQRIKVVVKYDHYKKWEFKSQSTIQYGGQVPDSTSQPANGTSPQPR